MVGRKGTESCWTSGRSFTNPVISSPMRSQVLNYQIIPSTMASAMWLFILRRFMLESWPVCPVLRRWRMHSRNGMTLQKALSASTPEVYFFPSPTYMTHVSDGEPHTYYLFWHYRRTLRLPYEVSSYSSRPKTAVGNCK